VARVYPPADDDKATLVRNSLNVQEGAGYPEQEQVVPSPRTRRAWFSLLFLPLSAALIAWGLLIARATYRFSDPQAQMATELYRDHAKDIFTKAPHGIGLFFFLLLFLFSAIGPGDFVLKPLNLDWRDEVERVLLCCVTGLILFTFVMLIVGSAGFLQRHICFTLLGFSLLSSCWYWRNRFRQHDWKAKFSRESFHTVPLFVRERCTGKTFGVALLGLILVFYLYLALLGALSPEVQYDARWYHLGEVHAYVVHERFYNFIKETRMAAAAYDPYQSVLYTVLWKMTGMVGAKLLHWGDALLTVCALIYFCRIHFRSSVFGLVAAIIFISTPLISWSTSTAGNDLQLALYTLLSIHVFLRWREKPGSARWLVVLGMLGGYAIGSKLFGVLGLIILFIGVFIVSYRSYERRTPVSIALRWSINCIVVMGVAMLLTCLPWLVRSAVDTGSPTFPLFNSIFHSPYWNGLADAEQARYFSSVAGNRSLSMLLLLPRDAITIEPRYYRAVLGPLFTFVLPVCVGICILRRRRTAAIALFRLMAVYFVAWMALWFASNALDLRYTVAIMPIMAMLVAFPLVMHQWPGWPGKIFRLSLGVAIVGITVLNLQPLVPFQRLAEKPGAFGYSYVPWTYLYGGPPDGGLAAQQPPALQYINQQLNPFVDKVYDAGGISLYAAYSQIELFDGYSYEGPAGLQEWNLQSVDALQHLRQENITYLYATKAQIAGLMDSPLASHLQEVFHSPDMSDVLFKMT
jgi:hypothetical protein